MLTPTQRVLRTTRPVPTIFPTTIIVSLSTGRRLIITVPPLTCGERTFATIHGMTIIGIRRTLTGLDITPITDGVTVIGRITVAAIGEGTEGISLPADKGQWEARGVVMASFEVARQPVLPELSRLRTEVFLQERGLRPHRWLLRQPRLVRVRKFLGGSMRNRQLGILKIRAG